jgi:hypothetical protein
LRAPTPHHRHVAAQVKINYSEHVRQVRGVGRVGERHVAQFAGRKVEADRQGKQVDQLLGALARHVRTEHTIRPAIYKHTEDRRLVTRAAERVPAGNVLLHNFIVASGRNSFGLGEPVSGQVLINLSDSTNRRALTSGKHSGTFPITNLAGFNARCQNEGRCIVVAVRSYPFAVRRAACGTAARDPSVARVKLH